MQVGALHPQRPRRARNIPARFFERPQHMLALGRFARFLHARPRAVVALRQPQFKRNRRGA